MRRMDWASTKLGPVHAWPQSLRAMIPAMLASRFAMRVVWGPEHIMLYNDAYLPVLGKDKHPRAMGAPTARELPRALAHRGARCSSACIGAKQSR